VIIESQGVQLEQQQHQLDVQQVQNDEMWSLVNAISGQK
jgi:hypothetical protein